MFHRISWEAGEQTGERQGSPLQASEEGSAVVQVRGGRVQGVTQDKGLYRM